MITVYEIPANLGWIPNDEHPPIKVLQHAMEVTSHRTYKEIAEALVALLNADLVDNVNNYFYMEEREEKDV